MTKWVATGALAAAMSFSLPKLEPFGQLNHVIGKQDKASLGKKQDRVGGINLSDENLTLNIKDDGAGMPLPVQFQDKAMKSFNGLVSVIRQITPVTAANVPALYQLLK